MTEPAEAWPVQGGLVPFEIGVEVVGDVTIGMWIGSHKMGDKLNNPPVFAYAFHTAFVTDVSRIETRHLDIPDRRYFPKEAHQNFFMDIKLDDLTPKPASEQTE